MTDYATWSYGGVTLPLVSPGTNSLLQDADPAVYYTLDYFQSVINTYIGARLVAEAAKSPAVSQITSAVSAVLPYDPAPYLTENQFKFPLLALYRSKGSFKDHTIAWPHRIAEMTLQYILPPLNAGQAERLLPALNAVATTIHERIENMFDPSYQSGLKVWQAAGIESIILQTETYGRWDLGQGLSFPTWTAKLQVAERVSFAAGGLSPLAGLDLTEDVASNQQPSVTDFISGKYDYVDPTTIPGLVSLWRPDANVTLAADGEHVPSISDQSGTNALAQATSANQPILFGGAVTDFAGTKKPVLRFDGAASYLVGNVSALANDGSKSIVALVRLSDAAKRSSPVAQTLAADGGAHSMSIDANTASSAGARWGLFADASSFDSSNSTDTSWHVVSLIVTSTTNGSSISSSATLQVDGSATQTLTLKSGAGTWQGMSTANQIALGAIPGLLSTTAFQGDLGPVLVFNAALTSSQLQSAITYCKQWAGLS